MNTQSPKDHLRGFVGNEKPCSLLATVQLNGHPIILKALIDTGAESNFMDRTVVDLLKIDTKKLDCKIPVQLFDGSISEEGTISQIASAQVTFTKDPELHTFSETFLVTQLHKEAHLVLGLQWLMCHNPDIDWPNFHMRWDRNQDIFVPLRAIVLGDTKEPSTIPKNQETNPPQIPISSSIKENPTVELKSPIDPERIDLHQLGRFGWRKLLKQKQQS